MDHLASRITEAINSSDLRQVEIARQCGVSIQNVTNWKNKGQIRNDKLLILAKTLGTTVDWLLGDDNSVTVSDLKLKAYEDGYTDATRALINHVLDFEGF
jgi:transcriptional regulator with XRE-family HTH domain